MDTAEFQRILNIGLGRVILYLQQHSASPHRDAILYTCLNDIALDPQLEGSHADYLWEIIQLSGEPDFYKTAVLDALEAISPTDQNEYLVLKLFDLAFCFAKAGDERAYAGDERAYKVIHQQFVKNLSVHQGRLSGVDGVIALDGIDGLLLVMDEVIKAGLLTDYVWELKIRVDLAVDDFGEQVTWGALREAAKSNPRIKTYLDSWRTLILDNPTYPKQHPRPMDYDELRKAIALRWRSPPDNWFKWIEGISDHLLRALADDLLTEQDPQRLAILVRLFTRRTFPLDPARLIFLAEHGDERIEHDPMAVIQDRMARFALAALERVTHPDVRTLALRMIANNNRVGRAVGLLENNFADGDWGLLTELTKRPLGAEDYHSLGWSIRSIYEKHPSEEAVDAFVNMYEYGACTACRERSVEILHHMNKLPDWMLEECRYDANEYLREKARRGFIDVEV